MGDFPIFPLCGVSPHAAELILELPTAGAARPHGAGTGTGLGNTTLPQQGRHKDNKRCN